MVTLKRHGNWVILLSFLIALVLYVFPMPSWLAAVRPEWTALVLIYWCLAIPERIGIAVGSCIGLFQDVILGSLMGQHAFTFCIIAYLVLKLHKRIRVFPPWQQALSIFVILVLHQLLILWINGIIGQPAKSWDYWLPSISSMLIWPIVFSLLRGVRRSFKVS